MKNSRLEKIPAPISLSKRGTQSNIDSATPYRMEWGTPLQTVDSNNSKPHKSTISTMKEELSNIKTDVEKLLNEDCPETRRNTPSELISKSVRAQLDYHKEVEEKLRVEIRELKLRLSEEKVLKEEKEALEKRVDQLRTEWKAEKAKLRKFSEEAALKHSEEIARWKSDYESLVQRVNTLSKQRADLEQHFSEEQSRLLKTVGALEKELAERHDEYEAALKERQCKYQNALGEFKKLEVKFDRSTQESVLTLMHKNISLEQELANTGISLEDYKRRLSEQTHRHERALHYQEELKARNSELEDKLRGATRQNELQQELHNAVGKLQACEASKSQLYTTYVEKCREYEELMEEFQSRQTAVNPEVQRLRIQNLELQKMNELVGEQLKLARDRINYLDAIMIEKDGYIEAMEDLQQSEASVTALRELQEKCLQLLQERNELVRNYENAIRVLESSMEESRERSLSQSMMFSSMSVSGTRKATFDEALKEQIQENQELRIANKEKAQEIFQLRGQLDEAKLALEAQRSERELEKVRALAADKNSKNTFEITIQDLRNELESQKRKQETLQRKVDQKSEDIRRKDDFIKSSIIGRIGKQESETDVQYLARELEKFINVTALDYVRMV